MIEIIIPEEEELTVEQMKEKREYHKKEIEKIDKELEALGVPVNVITPYMPKHRQTPYERTRGQVQATGNKWAMENFEATH